MGPAWSTGYSVMLIVSLDRISVRAAYSPAAPVPQNLTSGRHSERLTPKSLILEVIGLGRMGPIFMAASCSQDVTRPIHQDPRHCRGGSQKTASKLTIHMRSPTRPSRSRLG